jgi:putative addiction module component (TIGR02574 family)
MSSENILNPKVIAEIKSLNIQKKLEIVEDIWQSIFKSGEKLPVSTAHKKDLDERLKNYKTNPDEESSWEDVKKRIESKI